LPDVNYIVRNDEAVIVDELAVGGCYPDAVLEDSSTRQFGSRGRNSTGRKPVTSWRLLIVILLYPKLAEATEHETEEAEFEKFIN